MSVSLSKGQKVSLAKVADEVGVTGKLNKITVGLGWDAAKRGLFGRTTNIDLDASAIMLIDDKLAKSDDVVYYGNLQHKSCSVKHLGDNLTGDGDGDDEQINVFLDKIPSKYNRIVFVVNIYGCKTKKQDFGMIENAFIRIFDTNSGVELCKFNLSDDYAGFTGMICGELYRHNDEWKFNPIGQGTHDSSISVTAKSYK